MTRFARRLLCRLLACGAVLLAAPAGAVCTGDCDGNAVIGVDEIVAAVGIALGRTSVDACRGIDRNDSGTADIDELLAAVGGLLAGCSPGSSPTPSMPTPATATASQAASATVTETATASETATAAETSTASRTAEPSATPLPPSPSATASATADATATPTATLNQPPLLPTASIYRTYPGFPILVPLDAGDPEGAGLDCSMDDLPPGAVFDAARAALSWTPSEDQLGAFYLPYSCTDAGPDPATSRGQLAVRVSPLDGCAIPDCDPAAGCTSALPPVSAECCAGEPTVRVPEPVAGCPEGRVLYVGQNARFDSFGRLQNCDTMFLRNFLQSGAEARFHIETRCMNTRDQVQLHARMESDAADHPLLFDTTLFPFELAEHDDGFARFRNLRFAVLGPGPFFDVQDADANLTLTLTDADGVSVSHSVRLRLTFTPRPTALPDVDPTLPPTPTRTARPS